MPRKYVFATGKGPVEIALDPEGQIIVDAPMGPIIMTVWTLEDAFIAEFDGFDVPRQELQQVYQDFSKLHPARRSESPD